MVCVQIQLNGVLPPSKLQEVGLRWTLGESLAGKSTPIVTPQHSGHHNNEIMVPAAFRTSMDTNLYLHNFMNNVTAPPERASQLIVDSP